MAHVAAADRGGRFGCNAIKACSNRAKSDRRSFFSRLGVGCRRPEQMTFHHKNIRLPRDEYVGKNWLFITVCCANRRKVFTTSKICSWFLNVLRRDATTHDFAVHAYCIMPDHIHLLLEGLQTSSNLLHFVKALKTKTSTPFERKTIKALWQKKFYDHILRRNDSADDIAWYIWMNPVRAGLCRSPNEYPFLGSFTGIWPKTPAPCAAWLPPWRKNTIQPV
jgi:putative transposase